MQALLQRVSAIATVAISALALAGCNPVNQPPPPPPMAVASAEITEPDFIGRLYVPAGAGPHPALLVIGGSEGGIAASSRTAAALRDAGYATLAVGYFGLDGLPEQLERVPLEAFTGALDWLAARPEVDPTRIGAVGISKGAEAALLLAVREPRVRAVVAATPTAWAWQSINWDHWSDTPSWTWRGAAVPYLRYVAFNPARHASRLATMYDESIAAATPEALAAARIPIEQSPARFLLIAGDDDRIWNALDAGRTLAAAMTAHGVGERVTLLEYRGAGPAVFGKPAAVDDAAIDRAIDFGGTADGTRAAVTDSWARSQNFLAQALAPIE